MISSKNILLLIDRYGKGKTKCVKFSLLFLKILMQNPVRTGNRKNLTAYLISMEDRNLIEIFRSGKKKLIAVSLTAAGERQIDQIKSE
jgi:hypothetical protein